MGQINDISLIAQVVTFGNKRAFDRLVCKYQSPLRRFLLHLTCGDESLSDDLAQETFIKAYTSLSSFRNMAGFSTWLFRIAYNQFYDYLRSQKETVDLETGAVDAEYSDEQTDCGKTMDVYAAMKVLKEEERTCITLFYMEDMTLDKIVAVTGYPLGTVKSHLSRGKEKMVKYLKRNGYGNKQ
jgi:RNA polymerase sigma-70 factor (ECF subfamily)